MQAARVGSLIHMRRHDAESATLPSPQELDAFFAACDAREEAPEPDWAEHEAVIDASRRQGLLDRRG